ncbi:MAG: PrsW family intramembrane metalloprotease [Thermoactinomycetaceae bacterium]|nr:PrsW family intramembrane metalloprotease [Thermoactinomycetaceae bacterium]
MQNFRLRLREILDRLQEKWLQWKASHPGWIRAYTVFSTVSLLVFLLGLFFFEDARKIFVQFLWSLYLLWQFWILARSKTFTWKTYSAFFLVGAWVIPFITQGFVAIIHLLFGGEPSDWWSIAVVTPIAEEIFKLLPLFVYLWLSRRATALSLSDYALIGAAVGGGFQMMEEVARRLASGKIWGYGFSIWDGQVIHWEFFDLFPGYFESSYFATEMMSGHAVITALTALGVGLGIRWRRKGGRAFLLVPLLLLSWAVLDHAVWNDSGGDLPEWADKLHDALGSGYYAEPALLILLALGIFLDYRDMNRIGDRLPRLPGERVIHPFGELRHLFWAFLADPRLLAHSLLFVQDRKQLAFSLLGAETVFDKGFKRKREEALSRGLDRHREQMLAIIGTFALLGLVLTVVIAGAAASAETACFACLFDSLANWWEGLDGWEQGLIFLGALALGWWLFGGFQLAFTILTTLISIAENGHAIARFLRNPLAETRTWWDQWSRLTPEQRLQAAASTFLSAAFHRLGGGVVKKTIQFAKKKSGWPRFEEEDLLPGSLGVSKTKSLFSKVRDVAYKEDPKRKTTFGIPDNIVVEDGRITIVEEAKMWSRRDFEQLAELAKENPRRFLDRGIPAVSDKRQMRYIQFAKHKRSVEYLLSHLDQFPWVKQYGITRADSDVVYMLKVPKRAPDEALETMRKVFEERLNIKVTYRKIDW